MIEFLVGLLTGVISGFGIGGGSLLILWLTIVDGTSQWAAGGLNLLYFICCAPPALVSHIKNRLVEKRAVLWCVLAGIPTSLAAAWIAAGLDVRLLRRGFGLLLLYIGCKELFARNESPTDAAAQK